MICSPGSGCDTEELRSNDRKLLFEDIGVITMRPSDVPTYVEAGAADLGVTGKDVLLEQAPQRPGEGGREVYELLDLGYGRCTMVLASKAGPDPALEALRRLGVMRVATKYPRIAARYLEETGRQAEIVEVKGSVELAPLTGMVEAIVDLTATGTTLRENNLIVREEIVVCTARLIANPVAHKLKAAPIDDLLEQAARPARRGRRLRCGSSAWTPRTWTVSAVRPAPPPTCARSCPAATRWRRRCARSSAGCARRATQAVRDYTRRFDTAGSDPRPLVVAREELDEAIKLLPLELVAGTAGGDRERRARGAGGRERGRDGRAAAGAADHAARAAGGLGGRIRARRARALPEHGRDGRRDRTRRRRAGRRRVRSARAPTARSTRRSSASAGCAGWSACTAWAARRRSLRSHTAPRRSTAVDVVVGPGNLYVQEAKRLLSATVGIDGFAGPSDLLVLLDADAGERDRELAALDMLAQGEHGEGSLVVAVSPGARVSDALAVTLERLVAERPTVGEAVVRARRGLRRARGAWRSRTRSRPSTCS